MPRKRTSLAEVLMKDQRRKRLEAKRRLSGVMVCPRCEKEQVVLNVQKGRFTYVTRPGKWGGDVHVKCKIARVLCKSCKLSITAGLLPGEDLVDLYCWMYDREKEDQWIDLVSSSMELMFGPVDQG